jgi:ribosomal-protein-alanine N-acetyltransferase
MTTLATERLILRPLVLEDVPALHRLHNNPEVRRYLWENRKISAETVREIVIESEECFETYGAGFFGIELVSHPGVLTGFCGFRRFEGGDQPELLLGILPEYRGEGFVTEAGFEVLKFGFESCGMESVIGATDTPNQRAVLIMQRLGMIFRERKEYRGLDMVFYGLTREEFSR